MILASCVVYVVSSCAEAHTDTSVEAIKKASVASLILVGFSDAVALACFSR